MAKQFPLEIILSAVDRTSGAFRTVNKSLQTMEKTMAKIGERSVKIGRNLTRNISAPVAAIGAIGVKAFSDFEDGMASVSTLVDTNVESMDDMSKKVLEVGRRTPVSIGDLTAALYQARSGGVDAANAMTVLEKSAQLGVAGLGTTAEAMDIVTSAFNSSKLEGEDAEKVYDNVFKAVKYGKTDISKLADGFGAVAGTVAKTGTPLDEYLASVSALTTTGLPAAQAHTQISAAIAKLSKNTKETSKIYRKLGAKDLPDLIAKSGGLVGAFSKINKELGGNQTKILELLRSKEAAAALTGLADTVNDKVLVALDDMRNGADAVGEGFEKKNKTAAASIARTKNALQSAAISIGKILVPVVEKLAAKLQELSAWWETLDDDTKKTIVTVAAVAAAVGPALIVFGKLAGSIGTVIKVARIMGVVFLTNPIGLAVAGIVAASVLLTDNWRQFGAFWGFLWDDIKSVVQSVWSYIEGVIEKIASGIEKVAEGARTVRDFVGGSGVMSLAQEIRGQQTNALPSGFGKNGGAQSVQVGGKTKVEIELKNAPQGTRVKAQSVGDVTHDMTTGYQMGS